MLADYGCRGCGHEESDVLTKNPDEPVMCSICDAQMERIYSGTRYKSDRRHKEHAYPTELLGRGNNRASFSPPDGH